MYIKKCKGFNKVGWEIGSTPLDHGVADAAPCIMAINGVQERSYPFFLSRWTESTQWVGNQSCPLGKGSCARQQTDPSATSMVGFDTFLEDSHNYRPSMFLGLSSSSQIYIDAADL